jgi:hypothetical protein
LHIYIHTVIDFEEGCRKMKKEKERIICAIPKEDICGITRRIRL